MKSTNEDLKGEIWVTHPIGIRVSNLGRVWTRNKGKHYGYKGNPYLQVGWKGKKYSIHRLICEAFHPNENNLPTVDHIDRNPLNNRIENLRWADHLAQMKNRELDWEAIAKKIDYKAFQAKRVSHTDYKAIGEKVAEKLSIPILQLNKETLEVIKEWKSATEAAREGGFQQTNITQCCKGKYKSHKGFIWRYA